MIATDRDAGERGTPVRTAGRAQGLTLIAVSAMPTLVVAALVSDLPQLFERFAGVPNHEFLVPMIITVPSLCVALFSGIAGVIADRWGRRRLLIVALAAFAMLGLMPLFFSSLTTIIASRAVVGLAEASILTCCNALYGDYFAEDERKQWLGWQQMCGPFFNAALAVTGGALATIDWRAPFWLYALGIPVLLLVAAFSWEPARATRVAESSRGKSEAAFPWRVALPVAAVTVCASMVFFMLAIQQARIFTALGVSSPAKLGLLVMVVSTGAVLGAFVFRVLRHWPFHHLLALALAAYGICFVGLSQSSDVATGVGFSLLGQLGSSVLLPALIAWTLGSFAAEHRGRGMGLWGSMFFAGQFISAPLLTLFELWRGTLLSALGTVGVLVLFTLPLAWWTQRPSAAKPQELA